MSVEIMLMSTPVSGDHSCPLRRAVTMQFTFKLIQQTMPEQWSPLICYTDSALTIIQRSSSCWLWYVSYFNHVDRLSGQRKPVHEWNRYNRVFGDAAKV